MYTSQLNSKKNLPNIKNLPSAERKNQINSELPHMKNLTRSTGTDVTFEVDNVGGKKLAPAVGHVYHYLLHPSSKQKGDQHLRFPPGPPRQY